jgi:hypothetical protein
MTTIDDRQHLANQVSELNVHYLHGWMTMHVSQCDRRRCQVCAELRRAIEYNVESNQATKGAA